MHEIVVPDYIKGLIFDCDGTLVDSMTLHMRAWEHAITSKRGVWQPEFFIVKKGMAERGIVILYNKHYGTSFDPAETVKTKHEYFRAHASEFKPVQRVVDIVLKYRDILPMAVASGGMREIVEFELDALRLKGCFKAIVTADDAIKPKPSPDIFLEAARQIGVPPQFCQVFEDGDLGLEAARTAGMLATDIRVTRTDADTY
jgi:HAD superfamily hydrolase (TIGR01509 family)